MIAMLLVALAAPLPGPWRGVLDLAGGRLKFGIELERKGAAYAGRLCNGSACDPFSAVVVRGDSVRLELADYAASISAVQRGDSLVGVYRNVGNRGPRTIPFRAAPGRWPRSEAPRWLAGRWDAQFEGGFEREQVVGVDDGRHPLTHDRVGHGMNPDLS